MISNWASYTLIGFATLFQSPMGISMISNSSRSFSKLGFILVSIPNGDKHDFKLVGDIDGNCISQVSIPNGDKHDFKRVGAGGRGRKSISFNPQWG